ncbi:integrase [Stygiolobus caldivivus]|uniref:Integrase SSV1 C-terminal domain-containing protein n=1 Tax=Stygiolobus caldivivus TaxID=2824673 RepID=A0A8D5U8B9_9CREN|nr:integrase [Stygiolobus caldivivus]BCU70822.1 hypothetical protein KN1_21190 [Stygiolobus caldivivus]
MYPTKVAGPGFEPGSQGPEPWLGEDSPKTPRSSIITNTSVITKDLDSRRDKKIENLPSEAGLIAFYNDCVKKVSKETCKQYVNYLRKPLDVNNKGSVLAWKKYYKWKGDLDKWKAIKTKKSGVDLKVPSEAEIKEWLTKVKGTKVETLFKLLLESGIRLTEAVKVLNEYDPKDEMSENSYYIYILNWSRGSKRVFYVFHTTPLQRQGITYNYAKKVLHQLGVEPKYLRKFVATKLLELGVPGEIVDFIEGRTPSQILTKHYLDLLTLAKKYYPTYVSWLKQIEFF